MLFLHTLRAFAYALLLITAESAQTQSPTPAAPPQATTTPGAISSTSPSTSGTGAAPANSPVIPSTQIPAQLGPPSSPANQQMTAPPGLQVSSGDLLDVSVYGVPDLTQRVRVSNAGDAYF